MDSEILEADKVSLATETYELFQGMDKESFGLAHPGLLPAGAGEAEHFDIPADIFFWYPNMADAKLSPDKWCWHIVVSREVRINYLCFPGCFINRFFFIIEPVMEYISGTLFCSSVPANRIRNGECMRAGKTCPFASPKNAADGNYGKKRSACSYCPAGPVARALTILFCRSRKRNQNDNTEAGLGFFETLLLEPCPI